MQCLITYSLPATVLWVIAGSFGDLRVAQQVPVLDLCGLYSTSQHWEQSPAALYYSICTLHMYGWQIKEKPAALLCSRTCLFIFLPRFGFTCPFSLKNHSKSVEVFGLISFILWWNNSLVIQTIFFRLTPPPATVQRDSVLRMKVMIWPSKSSKELNAIERCWILGALHHYLQNTYWGNICSKSGPKTLPKIYRINAKVQWDTHDEPTHT